MSTPSLDNLGEINLKVVLIATHQLTVEYEVALDRCLGVLLLSSSIERLDVDCEVLDFYGHSLFDTEDPEGALSDIISKILEANPDILGLTTMSNNLILALDICERVKQETPRTFTLLGGPGVSFIATDVIREFSFIDGIIRGEADIAFPQFVERLTSAQELRLVKGLVYRSDNDIVDNGWPDPIGNLDETPMPQYALLKHNIEKRESITSIEIGRGCPFNCTFCSTSTYFKRRYRVKSVERVMREIDEIQKYSKDTMIAFNHDLLTFNKDYVSNLCKAIMTRAQPVTWGASVRFDTIDSQTLELMRNAGCRILYIGVEVVTPRMQKLIRKGLDLSYLESTIRKLLALDFHFTLSFIVGLPDEEPADVIELLSKVLEYKSMNPQKVGIQIHALCLIPGSSLYNEWKSQLIYDDYGAPGHSDFPNISWIRLRNEIRKYPHIFPVYYHITTSLERRKRDIKLAYLSSLIDGNSSYSVLEAYSLLGQELPKLLISHIDDLRLFPPDCNTTHLIELQYSLREVILSELKDRNLDSGFFDTASKMEIALAELIGKRNESGVRILYTKYDPVQLFDFFRGEIEINDLEARNRYTALAWDSETGSAKTVEIPDEYGEFLIKYL